MRSRCTNPDNRSYSSYGGRGIRVCKEWDNDYVTFRNWAHSNGYQEHLTLERRDPDKGYDPTNCEWITLAENSRRSVSYRVSQIERLKERVQWLEAQVASQFDL